MLRFLLNAILAFVALRFVLGVARFLGGGTDPRKLDDDPRERVADPREGGEGTREGERFSGTDRASVIDVPYTEVEPGDGKTADTGKAESDKGRP